MSNAPGILVVQGLDRASHLGTEDDVARYVERFFSRYGIQWRNRLTSLRIVCETTHRSRRGQMSFVTETDVEVVLCDVERRSADSLLQTLIHELDHVRYGLQYGYQIFVRSLWHELDTVNFRRIDKTEPRAKRVAWMWMLRLRAMRIVRAVA